MRNKMILVLFLFLSIFLFFPNNEPGTIVHAASDPIDDMFDHSSHNGSKLKRDYSTEPTLNYQLDSKEASFLENFAPVLQIFNGLNNMIWYLTIFIVKFAIFILEQAYTLDILNSLLKYVGKIVSGVKTSTYDVFSKTFIVISALVALWNFMFAMKRQKSWEQLIILLIMIGLSTVFFTKPTEMLTQFNEISKEASADILTTTSPIVYKDVNGIDDAVVVMGNTIWKNHVKYPWYILEFGNVKKGEANGEELLKYAPYSDERDNFVKNQVKKQDNKMMSLSYSILRFILVILFLVYALITMVVIVIFSVLMLVYQIIPLLLIAFTGVIFLVSLWPGIGTIVVQRWLGRIASAILNKVFISIFLSIYMILSTLMYKAFDGNIIMQLVTLFVVAIVLILERKRIMGIFEAMPKGGHAVANEIERPSNYGQRIKNRAFQALALAYSGEKAYRLASKGFHSWQNKRLRPDAQTYLHQQYERQKQEAEDRSYETGNPVYYSDFVNQVNERMEQGLPLFTGKQIEDATNTLKDIKKQGGDYRNLQLPTGVNTTDPASYTKAAQTYQDELLRKKSVFEQKRQEHKGKAQFAMKHLKGSIPNYEDDEIQLSPEVLNRQNAAKDLRRFNNQFLNTENEVAAASESGLDNHGYKARIPSENDHTPMQQFNHLSNGDIINNRQFLNTENEVTAASESGLDNHGYKARIPSENDYTPMQQFNHLSNGDIIKDRQAIAKALRRTPSKPSVTVPENVTSLSEEGARNLIAEDWNRAKNGISKNEFIRQLKEDKNQAKSSLNHLKMYEKYENDSNLDTYKTLSPNEYKAISNVKETSGLSTKELIGKAQSNYKNTVTKLQVAKNMLGIPTETILKVKQNSNSGLNKIIEHVNVTIDGPTNTTIKERQEKARSMRRTPPKSNFMLEKSLKELSPQEIHEQVKVEWKQNSGTKPANFVHKIMIGEKNAKAELHQLKVYQEYESKGQLDKFQLNHKGAAEQIQKLKKSLNLGTQDLISLAEKNVKNYEMKVNAAQKQLNFESKSTLKVDGQREIKVRTPEDYEKHYINNPIPKNIRIEEVVKVDKEFKQSIINDFNKQHNLFDVQPREYLNEWKSKKNTHYKNIQLFKKAKKQTSDPKEFAQIEEMLQSHRALYMDAKSRVNLVQEMFDIKPQIFKKKDTNQTEG